VLVFRRRALLSPPVVSITPQVWGILRLDRLIRVLRWSALVPTSATLLRAVPLKRRLASTSLRCQAPRLFRRFADSMFGFRHKLCLARSVPRGRTFVEVVLRQISEPLVTCPGFMWPLILNFFCKIPPFFPLGSLWLRRHISFSLCRRICLTTVSLFTQVPFWQPWRWSTDHTRRPLWLANCVFFSRMLALAVVRRQSLARSFPNALDHLRVATSSGARPSLLEDAFADTDVPSPRFFDLSPSFVY